VISSCPEQAGVLIPKIRPDQIVKWSMNSVDDGKFDEISSIQKGSYDRIY